MLVPFRPEGGVYSIEALREELRRQELMEHSENREANAGDPPSRSPTTQDPGRPSRAGKKACRDGSKLKRPKDEGPLPAAWAKAEQTLAELYQPPFQKPGTWRRHRYVLRLLARSSARLAEDATANHADIGPCGITPGLIAKFAQELLADGHERSGVNSIMRTVRAMVYVFEDAKLLGLDEHGDPKVSPFTTRRGQKCRFFLREGKGDPTVDDGEHHSLASVRRILSLAESEWRSAVGLQSRFRAGRRRALIALIAYSGLRKSEALTLRWQHVDFERRIVWVVDPDGENLKTEGSTGPVPMPEALARILGEWHVVASGDYVLPQWRTDKPWRDSSGPYRPTTDVAALGERAGVAGLTLKSLRKTWATHAESAWGLSREQIQRVLRHTQAETQDWYREADVDNLRSLGARIDY